MRQMTFEDVLTEVQGIDVRLCDDPSVQGSHYLNSRLVQCIEASDKLGRLRTLVKSRCCDGQKRLNYLRFRHKAFLQVAIVQFMDKHGRIPERVDLKLVLMATVNAEYRQEQLEDALAAGARASESAAAPTLTDMPDLDTDILKTENELAEWRLAEHAVDQALVHLHHVDLTVRTQGKMMFEENRCWNPPRRDQRA